MEPNLTVHVSDKQFHAAALGIKMEEIRKARKELEAACIKKIDVSKEFTDLVKVVALKARIEPSVLSSYITAICNDTIKKKEIQAEQMSLLFDELE